MRLRWTEENIREEAAKYKTKVDFDRGSRAAYHACLRRFKHIIEEMFENQNRSWNEVNIREEAAKYKTKIDFRKGSSSAYQACYRRFPHIFEEMFENQLMSWDEVNIREKAAKYKTKVDFRNGLPGAYQACLRRFPHLLDEMFENQRMSWDEENLREEASKYKTKIDFDRGSRSAYQACQKRFPHILDEMFENQSNASSYDVAYLWRSSKNWWKFGVTSLRLGDIRVHQVSASADTKVEEMYMWSIDNALVYERFMKDLGERLPPSDKFNGHTECRYLFDWEVEQAIRQGDSLGKRIEVQ